MFLFIAWCFKVCLPTWVVFSHDCPRLCACHCHLTLMDSWSQAGEFSWQLGHSDHLQKKLWESKGIYTPPQCHASPEEIRPLKPWSRNNSSIKPAISCGKHGICIIFHQPRFLWNFRGPISLPNTYQPWGANRSCEVAIIWPLDSQHQKSQPRKVILWRSSQICLFDAWKKKTKSLP